MKKRRRVIFGAVIIVVIIILAGVGFMSRTETNMKKLETLVITNIDLSKVVDGVYTGSYRVFPVAAEVRVTINNKKITHLELIKHSNGQGSAAEVIPQKVVEAQALDLDVISGATYSSKVILKAIENALTDATK